MNCGIQPAQPTSSYHGNKSVTCDRCNMDSSDLPDMHAQARAQAKVSAYKSRHDRICHTYAMHVTPHYHGNNIPVG